MTNSAQLRWSSGRAFKKFVVQMIAAGFCVGVLAIAGLNILDFGTLLRPNEVGLLYVGLVGASLMTITAVIFFG